MAPSSSTSSVRAARARKGDITYIASHLSSSTQNIVQPTSRLSHIQHLHYDLDSVTVSLFVFYIRFDKYPIRYYCETSRLVYIATQRSNFDSITHSLCVLIILGKISQKTVQVLANCMPRKWAQSILLPPFSPLSNCCIECQFEDVNKFVNF